MTKYNDNEFYNIINEYANHPKVQELKNCTHHGIDRFDHSKRVAYYTYKITKKLHLNYYSATKAAMLHDFFIDELKDKRMVRSLRLHPNVAVENSKKYFDLTPMEEDIIKTHMFPVTFTPPKYLESWIVDLVDDVVSVYERAYSITQNEHSVANILALIFLGLLR